MTRVEEGTQVLNATRQDFSGLTAGAGKVAGLVSEISMASREQADGIEQVSHAVNDMDQGVQQVAANAEESASAVDELNAQARTMRDMLSGLSVLAGLKNGATVPASWSRPESEAGIAACLKIRPEENIPFAGQENVREFTEF